MATGAISTVASSSASIDYYIVVNIYQASSDMVGVFLAVSCHIHYISGVECGDERGVVVEHHKGTHCTGEGH